MDLTLRYWFPTHCFFGHAEGDKVSLKMFNKIHNDGVSVDNLVTPVWDGPNVNKIIF